MLYVLTMKKMTDFHSYKRVAVNARTNYLKKFRAVLKPLTSKTFQEASCSSLVPNVELSSDGPFHRPLAFCFPKTKIGSRERPCQSSWSRNFFGYITIQGTINFYSLCHGGVEDLQSIFSFRSNKCEILSPYVKKSKAKHLPEL